MTNQPQTPQTPPQPMLLAFSGPKTAGKDTAAMTLLSRNSMTRSTPLLPYEQINFADAVRSVCVAAFNLTMEEMTSPLLKETVLERWPFKSPRELMQSIGLTFRTMYGGNIWVKRWLPKFASSKAACVIITDLRHTEELDTIRALNGKVIYIENPKVEAIRLHGIRTGDPRWCDASEAFAGMMRDQADICVYNDGVNLQALYTDVQRAVATLIQSEELKAQAEHA